jgi:D-glycero-beta-D-manno-heptose-7-phosphate kinase
VIINDLIQIFDKFNNYNILIIGDVMVDSYMWGNVERISPEAPVPVVSVSKHENRPGGAANVAMNIKSLGANPIICSVVGDDENSYTLFDILKQKGIPVHGIIKSKNRKTTSKTRIISHNQHLLRIDEEIDKELSKEDQIQFIEHISGILSTNNIQSIIFEDYDKGVITSDLIAKVVELANLKDIPVSVDPKKRNFNNYRNITLFKPNFKEFIEGTKSDINKSDFEKLFLATRAFQNNFNIKYIIITLSESGMFISDGKTYHNIPAKVIDISDVSGAGDTVISVATLCLVAGLDIYSIAEISNIAGGIVCEKSGVIPIDKSLLIEECQIAHNI